MYEITEINRHRELIDKLDIAICALYDAENTFLAKKSTDFEISAIAQELLDMEISLVHKLENLELSAIKKLER